MSANQARLELQLDIIGLAGQRALALPTLKPAEFIAATLEEFGEIEVLGQNAADYQLHKAGASEPLDAAVPLGQQVAAGDHLVLREREPALPAGTQRPSRPAYLRNQESGEVYKLHWLPALIGRVDSARADNDRLAVDLGSHPAGQRVSRRQAAISEKNGQFYVERTAQNATAVKDSAGLTTLVEQRQPLQAGDTILLENSGIVLKFVLPDAA